MLVDSHAHLSFPELLSDIDGILSRAKDAGIGKIINVGTSLADSQKAIELAQKYDGLYATVGIHPNDDLGITVDNVDWVELENLAKQPKVVAIGETGLDFSRSQDKERQLKLFQKQIEIAKTLNLPLSIHVRDAQAELMAMWIEAPKGVLHCFSGDWKYLEWALSKGFYISFAGNVTFNSAGGLRELARQVPMERLLVETDCPFLAPEPYRGSRNEPTNVKITAVALAEIKNVSFEELAKITTENCKNLFGI